MTKPGSPSFGRKPICWREARHLAGVSVFELSELFQNKKHFKISFEKIEIFMVKYSYLMNFADIVWVIRNLITPLDRAPRVVLGTSLEHL
jgi:hypothetical protein